MRNITYLKSQLAAKRAQRDPLTMKPELAEKRAAVVGLHFQATTQLLQLMRSQWRGVLERGALELAVKEADMQAREGGRRTMHCLSCRYASQLLQRGSRGCCGLCAGACNPPGAPSPDPPSPRWKLWRAPAASAESRRRGSRSR